MINMRKRLIDDGKERDSDGKGNVMVGFWRWLLAKKMKDGMAYLEVLVGWKDEVWRWLWWLYENGDECTMMLVLFFYQSCVVIDEIDR